LDSHVLLLALIAIVCRLTTLDGSSLPFADDQDGMEAAIDWDRRFNVPA
jgi:hypothetical protein